MTEAKSDIISALLLEERQFPAPAGFQKQAVVRDPAVYQKAAEDPEAFWASFAEELSWFQKWSQILDWKPPHAKWFVGGKINASVNCVDRWAKGALGQKAAIIWEGEPGDQKVLTYEDLYQKVNQFASALKKLGVRKGDRVAIYLPLIPEAAIAMLACARIGAIHSVVFGGFSAEALRDRINDAAAKLLITADGGWRRGAQVPLKQFADEALTNTPSIQHVIVVKRTNRDVRIQAGRDHWWHDVLEGAEPHCDPEPMDAEDMLFTLYTSGTTGKPKGIIHTTGGYLVQTYATSKWVFDLKPSDIYWCTADVGWITGHSYLVYGPLANGATIFMYEGSPDWPQKDRFWSLIERYGITIFYTAPTAIRAFMKWGSQWVDKHNLSSLRLLGSVGEPINPEAWIWYHEKIGGGRCPIVDTWWQTETGAILITPLPGLTTCKPGSATKPFPGVEAKVLNEKGEEVKEGGGLLALTKPWPSMLRGIYGDPKRYEETYWSKWSHLKNMPQNVYFAGDGCKRDKEGYFWLLGRVDDVMNISGHRISTMEVESALVDHQGVAESAVVSKKHEIKGEAIAAFVILREGVQKGEKMVQELKDHVAKKIGAIARPEDIIFTADLPKTRSGKIMRRLLKDIAAGKVLGDTTTLADSAIVQKLKEEYKEE
ncbi:MAG: acetate--CoA ligase [Candidatus Omnitrophica bacterium CG11_big_fil_rev_8_21_14_0_20_45_26]|uniref:Acetyl-coenzyme A synthetase n=1 Tax=Candidatus Abzuiibacterium crystallinum TaxID=1974748 RepID=A0A2H0LKW8_9BACT|nr:MAG: acetate--CoA ligase [Candidatus Omnitrophica bacterium CG11_big_fil_rev_8_21_14_0_20_45_26]PIW63855.1 MAG: acetate--CoA ligase [Candidatus Omnitrophica bacterium CG12_big_fil_rev_8_21_14_0_65_45_16]